ncbi:MAG: FIST N-terminal domain-containing protein [Sulfuricurvum sp.]
MRQITYQYDTPYNLIACIHSYGIKDSDCVLIQIFSGILDLDIMHNVTQTIVNTLPHATVIGTTTSGEIINGQIQDHSILISISLFDNTTLKSMHLVGGNSQTMGHDIAKEILEPDTKCIIVFADGLHCNGEAILKGINSISPKEVVVAGGMSGDNGHYEKSYCIHGDTVFEKGIVAVALSNPALEVFHTYNLSWTPIGRMMEVTKSDGDILYELDNQPVKEVYSKYLGANVAENMPASTVEFPLIMHDNGVDIARSMIALTDEEGIRYAGELPEGKMVRFGIGSPSLFSDNTNKSYNLARVNPIEGLFIYSCLARKVFFSQGLTAEFEPLSRIAPLVGFFTYGEFYHGTDTNKFLNITTTVLGLSETKQIMHESDIKKETSCHPNLTISALANLVDVITQENEAYAQQLKYNNEQTQHYLDIAKVLIMALDNNNNVIMINQEGANFLGYEKDEIIGKNFITNFIPKSLQAEVSEIANHLQEGIDIPTEYVNTILTKNGDERLISWKNSPLCNKDGLRFGILTSGEDITEKTLRERQLKMRTKHAQMGEILSMIAHQWRQPLAAIAASTVSLKIQNELHPLTAEKLEKGLTNIENYTQHLSNTISDFGNFFKTDKIAIEMTLNQLAEESLAIISPILTSQKTQISREYLCNEKIKTYSNEFKHVLLNILKNAQDALEEKKIISPVITIKTYKENAKYCISIEDNAGGIPDTIINKIFEPYFTTKGSLNGTGLGLYMSKIIIDEHCNGEIEVENSNQGARFIIRVDR